MEEVNCDDDEETDDEETDDEETLDANFCEYLQHYINATNKTESNPDFPFGPIPHWVKCSERLPDEGQWVLLYSNDIYFGHLTRDGQYWIADEEDWLLNEFTHWMPLPPPPKDVNGMD